MKKVIAFGVVAFVAFAAFCTYEQLREETW